jgi:exopolysaccharide biosynthesis polyprenyl glycosylphosphotransferase
VPALPVQRRLGWQVKYVMLLVALDVVAVSVAGAAALIGRFGAADVPSDVPYWAGLVVLVPVWVGVVASAGAYGLHVVGQGTDEYKRMFDAGLRFSTLVILVGYAAHADLARSVTLLGLPAACCLALVLRFFARTHLARQRAEGRAMRRALVVGHGAAAFPMASRLLNAASQGFDVIGICLPDGADRRNDSSVDDRPHDRSPDRRRASFTLPVVGRLDDVSTLVRRMNADVIVVAPSVTMSPERLRRLAWELEDTGVELLVSPGLVDVAGPRLRVSPVDGQPLLHVQTPRLTGTRALLKSTFDRVVAGVGLLVLSPLLLLAMVEIWRDSPGPALFQQTRIGRGAKPFTMYKLRTMHTDAEQRLAELVAPDGHRGGPLFKLEDDPRVTGIGRCLRRWSIDELPQLLNVVLGHMSLVGPRPPLPREVARYEQDEVYRRLMVKPGLTGLWQVSGRADLDWAEAVRLDLYYVENWSLAFDMSIIWRTLGAVLRGRGAY